MSVRLSVELFATKNERRVRKIYRLCAFDTFAGACAMKSERDRERDSDIVRFSHRVTEFFRGFWPSDKTTMPWATTTTIIDPASETLNFQVHKLLSYRREQGASVLVIIIVIRLNSEPQNKMYSEK